MKTYDDIKTDFPDLSAGKSCSLDFPPGWGNIVYEVFRQIHYYDKRVGSFRITQVKEKFGALRIYTKFSDMYIEGIISMAEGLSTRTCSETGNPGQIYDNNGWIIPLSLEKAREKGLLKNQTPDI